MANKIPRVPVREQDPKVRATNFEEVCYGYNVEVLIIISCLFVFINGFLKRIP